MRDDDHYLCMCCCQQPLQQRSVGAVRSLDREAKTALSPTRRSYVVQKSVKSTSHSLWSVASLHPVAPFRLVRLAS